MDMHIILYGGDNLKMIYEIKNIAIDMSLYGSGVILPDADITVGRSRGTIFSGRIISEVTSDPIAGAPVMLIKRIDCVDTPIAYTLTDAEGFFMIGVEVVDTSAVYIIKTTYYDGDI